MAAATHSDDLRGLHHRYILDPVEESDLRIKLGHAHSLAPSCRSRRERVLYIAREGDFSSEECQLQERHRVHPAAAL